MAALADLEKFVSVYTPGAPLVVVRQMVQRTVDDFLTRTEVWKETISSVAWPDAGNIVLGANGQPTSSTVGAVAARFDTVVDAVQGLPLHYRTRAQLDLIDPDWYTATGNVPQLYTTGDSPSQLRIYPLAQSPQLARLRVRVALTVGLNSTTYPDFVFSRYERAITNGAAARVLLIPERDWSNPSLGASLASLYEAEIPVAKSRAAADHGNPHRQVAYGGI